jgi:hypothetical protein
MDDEAIAERLRESKRPSELSSDSDADETGGSPIKRLKFDIWSSDASPDDPGDFISLLELSVEDLDAKGHDVDPLL